MVRNNMSTGRGAFKPYYLPPTPPSEQMHAELKAFVPQNLEPTDLFTPKREAPQVAPAISILGIVYHAATYRREP